MGPLSLATGKRKFMLMAIDYFIMWVEAKAYAQVMAT